MGKQTGKRQRRRMDSVSYIDTSTYRASYQIVNILLDAGAVIFVKTNLPQTIFGFECSNPVWGRTTNPWNDKFTPGGSSGGEAALLAMDGSAAGIGTDIGGSLRIPAAYCGVYSLKPASGRTSYFGALGIVLVLLKYVWNASLNLSCPI